MTEKFDIIDYLAGLTGFVFDKAVLVRIALDRRVRSVEMYDELDTMTKELLKADLLYTAYISPNIWASSTNSHGSYTKTIGSQTIYENTKKRIYDAFLSIYKKYDDPKVQEVEAMDGNLQFLDSSFGM